MHTMQTIIYRMSKQQGPIGTGNYIQYPVISHNGKEYEKEYIYYIYIYHLYNHLAVQQKLTQCNSTILQ